MLDISYFGAAVAGLLSFFTPCVLPMVPFYLCYMAGLSIDALRDQAGIPKGAQRQLVLSSIFFALGVTTIFVLLGMGATALGQVFVAWRDVLRYLAAGVLTLFGLHFLGLLRIPLFYREARVETSVAPTTIAGAYLMGLAFGFGWTPCVGPALAAILMMAGGMGDIWQGGLLLLVYGLAMTAPFVIAALFARPFLAWVQRNRHYMAYAERIMGGMLLVFALLIATNTVNYIAQWMIEVMPAFTTLG